MKKKIAKILSSKKFACGFAAVALTVIIGSAVVLQQSVPSVEMPVYDADPIMEVSLEEEAPPLGSAPKTTTKTTKKTTKKNVKLSRAATKTYSKKIPTTKKTTKKTTTSSTKKVTTQTTVSTAKTEKYTKKSKVKVVTTTVTTTVKTTTTKLTTTTAAAVKTSSANTTAPKGKYEVSVAAAAPKADARVLNAFQTLGFKVYVDSSVSYSGLFDASARSITLKSQDDTIYHELGHFLAFIAGNADKTTDFKNIYAAEKNLYTGANKSYVTQNSAEYFAESFKNYTQSAGTLKSVRPKTYSAISAALNKVTTEQVTKVQKLYSVFWK